MEWLNLHAKTLDSPEVIGADPTERGTWLMLLRFCIGQENAGRIDDCREWKDRKWQQLLRVTKKEVETESDLWTWDGDALVVTFYPTDKEEEIRMKRDLARTNGKTGGRPKKNQSPITEKTNVGTEEKPTSDISPKAERKGKEGKGKEGELEVISLNARAHEIPTLDQVKAYAVSAPVPITELCAIAFHDTQETSGWITKHGHSIADWRAALRRYASLWNENEKSHRTNGSKPEHRQQRAANEYPEPKIQPRRL